MFIREWFSGIWNGLYGCMAILLGIVFFCGMALQYGVFAYSFMWLFTVIRWFLVIVSVLNFVYVVWEVRYAY